MSETTCGTTGALAGDTGRDGREIDSGAAVWSGEADSGAKDATDAGRGWCNASRSARGGMLVGIIAADATESRDGGGVGSDIATSRDSATSA